MKLEDKLMHLAIRPGQVGEYCILPGDPGRCGAIAERLERAERIAQNREFVTYTGYLDGQRGQRLLHRYWRPVGRHRAGGAGAGRCAYLYPRGYLRRHGPSGAGGAMSWWRRAPCGRKGPAGEYMPIQYPATADFQVTAALCRAAQSLGYRWHVGVVQSKDSFYGQHEPGRMPVHNTVGAAVAGLLSGGGAGQRDGGGGAVRGRGGAACPVRRGAQRPVESGARRGPSDRYGSVVSQARHRYRGGGFAPPDRKRSKGVANHCFSQKSAVE